MSREDAIAKLLSVRHYCFVRGVLGRGGARTGGDDADRYAFRIVNRLYVEVLHGDIRNGSLKSRGVTHKARATRGRLNPRRTPQLGSACHSRLLRTVE